MEKMKSKNLAEYDGEDKVISSYELMLKFKEQPDSIFKVKSNIPSLDYFTEGFLPGELIVISGPTKNGKTLLAQTLTVQFIKQQFSPLWFSFEINTRRFLNQFDELPMIFMPTKLKPHAMDWFEDRVNESFEKYHTRIVFCDHLHYLIDLARLRNPSIEIGQIIRRLKTLAINGDYLIFLLCHTSKGAHEDDLSYESIRDSSFISQESDSVFMIQRTPKAGLSRAQLSVEFHRRTGVLQKLIELEKVNNYLMEWESEDRRYGNE